MSKADIIKEIQQTVPPGSPEPQSSTTILKLTKLTEELITVYQQDGLLDEHPFSWVQDRTIHLYNKAIQEQVQGRSILITGGEGFVGSQLLKGLQKYSPRRLVSVDVASQRPDNNAFRHHYQANIADIDSLAEIFRSERPNVVYHLAAEREPERAEMQIKNTVRSNVFGTENVIRLCDDFKVERCVYASSGKAARYHTPDVYAGSKKLTEWQLAQAASVSGGVFSAVRFTHVLENSIVSREMDDKITRGLVSFHSPDRYMYVQTQSEAVNLLLNSLAFEKTAKCRVLTVRDLGWPIEVLTIPLFKMQERGVVAPLYFKGLPDGYESEFFKGQLDWRNPTEINPMINAQEAPFSHPDQSGDMSITRVVPFSFNVLNDELEAIRLVTDSNESTGADVKTQMSDSIKSVSQSAFEQTSVDYAWGILKVGIDPYTQNIEEVIRTHDATIELVTRAVAPRVTVDLLKESDQTKPDSKEMIQILNKLPQLQPEVAKLNEMFEN